MCLQYQLSLLAEQHMAVHHEDAVRVVACWQQVHETSYHLHTLLAVQSK
jgi:hypothetical protein